MSLHARIVASLFAIAALSASAKVDVVHKTGLPDKREGVVREKFLCGFDACSLNLEYSVKDGAVLKQGWGDYFFGLRLGYSPKNGGWNIWDFLQVYVRTSAGLVNVLEKSRPAVFIGYSAAGADFLAAEWEIDGASRLRLRFAAFPSHRDWLFLRVDCSAAPVERIILSAYPGNAAVPEGRERHVATKERDWCLNAEAAEWRPASPLALLYSRYVDDRFGNKLVFEPAALSSVRVGRTKSCISLCCVPAKDTSAATFALGYFAHKTPDDQLTRFLGEDGDAIYDFMKAIDWEAEPKSDDFKAAVRIALDIGVDRESLNSIARRYLDAAKRRDIATISECAAEVNQLRRTRVRDGLAEFGAEKKR
ncbi:MAG: hypothetical protein IJQ65_00440 [Kiritimatiellae bacterium]|nr:hypothetical protein [Kiritimatiellia bacterium]